MNTIFKYLIVTTLSLLIRDLNAQTLSIDDLIKIDKSSVENIETFLISKKFEFAGVEEDALAKQYNYSSKRSEIDYKKAKAHVTKYCYHSGRNSVSYQIMDAVLYKTIKNSLAAKGFKFVSKEEDGETLGQHYESTKHKVEIWQGIKDGLNWYEINLETK